MECVGNHLRFPLLSKASLGFVGKPCVEPGLSRVRLRFYNRRARVALKRTMPLWPRLQADWDQGPFAVDPVRVSPRMPT